MKIDNKFLVFYMCLLQGKFLKCLKEKKNIYNKIVQYFHNTNLHLIKIMS